LHFRDYIKLICFCIGYATSCLRQSYYQNGEKGTVVTIFMRTVVTIFMGTVVTIFMGTVVTLIL